MIKSIERSILTFTRTSKESHQDSRRKLTGVALGNTSPNRGYRVADERDDVNGPSAILKDEGHPEEVTSALKESGRSEAIGDLRNSRKEERIRWDDPEEVCSDSHNIDSGSSG